MEYFKCPEISVMICDLIKYAKTEDKRSFKCERTKSGASRKRHRQRERIAMGRTDEILHLHLHLLLVARASSITNLPAYVWPAVQAHSTHQSVQSPPPQSSFSLQLPSPALSGWYFWQVRAFAFVPVHFLLHLLVNRPWWVSPHCALFICFCLSGRFVRSQRSDRVRPNNERMGAHLSWLCFATSVHRAALVSRGDRRPPMYDNETRFELVQIAHRIEHTWGCALWLCNYILDPNAALQAH